jgi:hypothetical protein
LQAVLFYKTYKFLFMADSYVLTTNTNRVSLKKNNGQSETPASSRVGVGSIGNNVYLTLDRMPYWSIDVTVDSLTINGTVHAPGNSPFANGAAAETAVAALFKDSNTGTAGTGTSLNGSGYVKQNGATSNYVATIPIADLAANTISGIALGNNLNALTPTDTTLSFSGNYDGSVARTAGVNLANNNNWTANKTIFSAVPSASASNGVLNIGAGAFDGTTTGFFAGNSSGTLIAGNAASAYAGRLIDLQVGGATKFWVDASGNAIIASRLGAGSTTSPTALLHATPTTLSTSTGFSSGGLGVRTENCAVTSTSSSGTITTAVMNSLGIPTFSANSATTLTNAATLYIGGSPGAGTNVTITNSWALYVPFGNVLISNNTNTNRLTLGLSAFSSGVMATTNGALLSVQAQTITDSSTAASGTVVHGAINAITASTIAATNTSITYTNASSLYISGAPAAGANVAISNPYSIFAAAGLAGFAGGVNTGSGSGSNFGTAAGTPTGTAGTSSATMQVGGATVTQNRVFMNGSASATVAANASYTNLMVGSAPITINATGTHPVFANTVINPVGTISGTGATLTETCTLYVNGATTGGTTNNALHVAGAGAQSIIDGKLIMGGLFRKKGYTVAALPAGTQGDCAYVTDASSPTAGSTVTGGGTSVRPVFYNGTNWISLF